MNTLTKRYGEQSPEEDERVIQTAADIIKRGGLVAFPTETVYGLGANGLDPDAVEKIYKAKGRPADNPLILHIADISWLDTLTSHVPENARKLAGAFWPGPLTMVLPKSSLVPDEITRGLDTIAVRFPSNTVAQRLIRASGVPIAAPSANTSGRPSPTRAGHVELDLNGKIDMIIDGGPCEHGLESTIADVTAEPPRLLRPGAVTLEDIKRVIGGIDADQAALDGVFEKPIAPGMKYAHYAPAACVTIVNGQLDDVVEEIKRLASDSGENTGIMATDETKDRYDGGCFVLSVGERRRPETVAANLFDTLRTFDLYGVERVYAEGFDDVGVGLAIMNRLIKAAAFRIISV